MKIVCPFCGFEHEVPDEILDGKSRAKLRCASCRKVFEISQEEKDLEERSFFPVDQAGTRKRGWLFWVNLSVFIVLLASLFMLLFVRSFFFESPGFSSKLSGELVPLLDGEVFLVKGFVDGRFKRPVKNVVFRVRLYDRAKKQISEGFSCPGFSVAEGRLQMMRVEDLKDMLDASCGNRSGSVLFPGRMSVYVPVFKGYENAAFFMLEVLKKDGGGG